MEKALQINEQNNFGISATRFTLNGQSIDAVVSNLSAQEIAKRLATYHKKRRLEMYGHYAQTKVGSVYVSTNETEKELLNRLLGNFKDSNVIYDIDTPQQFEIYVSPYIGIGQSFGEIRHQKEQLFVKYYFGPRKNPREPFKHEVELLNSLSDSSSFVRSVNFSQQR